MKWIQCSLCDGIKDLWEEMKIDYKYMFNDFWANDYGVHFLAGLMIQASLILTSLMLSWFDQWFASMAIFTVIQLVFWTAKEVLSYCQEKWSFGIFPNSEADYRDTRFSMYGVILINIIYSIGAIIAY